MGIGSWFQKNVKDPISDAWDSTKDAVKGVTGIDSLNDAFTLGFGTTSGIGALQGRGLPGKIINSALEPLIAVPQTAAVAPTGSLYQSAPAMSMGAGVTPNVQSAIPDIASLFGTTADAPSTSAALLQANPEAYQFAPLFTV